MVKKMSFNQRFPHFGIILVLAIAISIPLTVWSLHNASTQIQQEAERSNLVGTITINQDPTNLKLGDWIDFTTALPKKTMTYKINVGCYTETDPGYGALYDPTYGYLVYEKAGGISDKFQLGGGSIWLNIIPWKSTTCHATLFYFDNKTQKYVPFAITPNFTSAGDPKILPLY